MDKKAQKRINKTLLAIMRSSNMDLLLVCGLANLEIDRRNLHAELDQMVQHLIDNGYYGT